jgi:hypothetical protein
MLVSSLELGEYSAIGNKAFPEERLDKGNLVS